MTLNFTAPHATGICAQLADYLTEQGWYVAKPHAGPRERPWQLAKRLQVSARHVHESLKDDCCPPFMAGRGPTGRIVWVVSNGPLEAWLVMHKDIRRESRL